VDDCGRAAGLGRLQYAAEFLEVVSVVARCGTGVRALRSKLLAYNRPDQTKYRMIRITRLTPLIG
jgi:hypothetical protein